MKPTNEGNQEVASEDTRSQMVAGAVVVWSFGLICLALGGMFSHGDDERLILTVGESFTGLREIRDIFKSTANFTVAANPVGVGHVLFPVAGPETLWEIEDLERRGLITPEQLRVASANASSLANDPSLLRRVLRLAWCTAWPGVGSLPADRAPGCRCIANAYLDFVNLTGRPASGVAHVPQAHRDEVGDRVFRCWDQRQMRRSRACGDVCKTQVLGLSVFANVVLFLASSAFLLSVGLRRLQFSAYPIKLGLVVLGVLICIPFYVQHPESNAFNLVGVVVCLFYLTVSLHYELGDGFADAESGPPLMACVMVNLPLIMSAHAVQIGVSGFGRDVWASISFGVCGGVIGLLFQVRCIFWVLILEALTWPCPFCRQRFYWSYKVWYQRRFSSSDALFGDVTKIIFLRNIALTGLSFGLVFAGALYVHLFVAYRFWDSPYAGNSWWVFLLYGLSLVGFALLLACDEVKATDTKRGKLTFLQICIIGLIAVASTFLTIVAVADVASST